MKDSLLLEFSQSPKVPQKRVPTLLFTIKKSNSIEIEQEQVKKNSSIFSIEDRWVVSQTDMKLGPILGQGSSCIVYKGEYKRTPEVYY